MLLMSDDLEIDVGGVRFPQFSPLGAHAMVETVSVEVLRAECFEAGGYRLPLDEARTAIYSLRYACGSIHVRQSETPIEWEASPDGRGLVCKPCGPPTWSGRWCSRPWGMLRRETA